jgi:hypothetical protein
MELFLHTAATFRSRHYFGLAKGHTILRPNLEHRLVDFDSASASSPVVNGFQKFERRHLCRQFFVMGHLHVALLVVTEFVRRRGTSVNVGVLGIFLMHMTFNTLSVTGSLRRIFTPYFRREMPVLEAAQ